MGPAVYFRVAFSDAGILLPQLKGQLVLGCVGRAVGKASPALGVLGTDTQTGLAVSSVENRNDTQQGKGAAAADGGSLALSLGKGQRGRSPLRHRDETLLLPP